MSGSYGPRPVGEPLWKPAKGSWRIDRHKRQRPAEIESEKSAAQLRAEDRVADRKVRYDCYIRDGRRCRAFGTPLNFEGGNPLKRSENHHIVERSLGGSDLAENRITLSFKAHRMVNDGLLETTGNGNGTVTFKEYEYRSGTRTFVREWQSTVEVA